MAALALDTLSRMGKRANDQDEVRRVRRRAVDVFSDEHLTELEQWVMQQPEGCGREIPLSVDLYMIAIGGVPNVRDITFDVARDELIYIL